MLRTLVGTSGPPAVGALLGAIAGGLLAWFSEELVKTEIQKFPWLLPLMTALAAAAAGAFIGLRFF